MRKYSLVQYRWIVLILLSKQRFFFQLFWVICSYNNNGLQIHLPTREGKKCVRKCHLDASVLQTFNCIWKVKENFQLHKIRDGFGAREIVPSLKWEEGYQTQSLAAVAVCASVHSSSKELQQYSLSAETSVLIQCRTMFTFLPYCTGLLLG